jgi:parvulin-like peptidyl-prolyl isomerase
MQRLIALVLGLILIAAGTVGAGDDFFGNEILVRGTKIEVRRADLERAYLQFKANATLRDQPIPDNRRDELEAMLLDRLVVTRILMNRATDEDRRRGQDRAKEFLDNVREQAGSDAAFERQLISLAFTRADFEDQILERAVCEEVVERVLQGQARISDAAIEGYYETNRAQLQRPEMAQARHILLATVDPATGAELSDSLKAEKRLQAENLVRRARQGEDFTALVKEFSDDTGNKDKLGEYIFSRGQMVPEFEAAAFSLQPDRISDVVTTAYGYHIIKLIRIIPSEPIPLDQIRDEIREKLEREKIQEELMPRFLEKLKEEAKLEYLNGARAPAAPARPDSPAP